MKALMNWFIPDEIKKDPDTYRRGFLLVGFSIGAFLAKTASAALGEFRIDAVILLIALFMAPFSIRITKKITLGGNLFVGGLLISLMYIGMAYGPSHNVIRWVVNAIPIAGFLLLSYRYSMFWTAISGIWITLIIAMRNSFWDETMLADRLTFDFTVPSIIDVYLNYIVILVIGILMERGKDQALAILDSALQQSEKLADNMKIVFKNVGESSEKISLSSEDFKKLGDSIEKRAVVTSQQAGEATSSSEDIATKNVVMAEKLDNLSKSIAVIGEHSAKASSVAESAVERARETDKIMSSLAKSGDEISKVSSVIFTIARQTNLLSLNAAIEAAKAGEAGKGFSVVAGEVKSLAVKTTQATNDISEKISLIKEGTDLAIEAISEINKIIESINNLQSDISNVVREQEGFFRDMNDISMVVSDRRKHLNTNIKTLAESAEETSQSISEIIDAANALSNLGKRLKEIVSQKSESE